MMMMMMTRTCEIKCKRISRRALGSLTTPFRHVNSWILARECLLFLKAWLSIIAEFLGSFLADHMRFDLHHPYIEHLLTL